MNKLLIKNATIINEGKRSSKDIYIEGEYIKEINWIEYLKNRY